MPTVPSRWTSREKGSPQVRHRLGLVAGIISQPDQFFHSTQIVGCLWILSHGRLNGKCRDSGSKTLFIDALKLELLLDSTRRDLPQGDIAHVEDTYRVWCG